jgi:hypothetical protein
LDATQTSEPTEAGPASPGRASTFQRALDDQPATEGPLDLTEPLNIAAVRAALSNPGPRPIAANAAAAPPPPAGSGPTPPRDHDGRHSRRHAGPKRLGRIAVFVVLAATASFGTAYALVLSSCGQSTSVSLPATDGNIPLAPSQKSSGQGHSSATSGSTSASAAPSPSSFPVVVLDTFAPPPPGTPAATTPSVAPDPSVAPSGGADPGASQEPSPTATPTTPPPTTSAPAPTWVTLYWGIPNESQEVSQVQSMLANLGYLDGLRHHAYLNPEVDVQPDPRGTYGSATEDAIAEFQQDYNVNYTGHSGDCDLATYQALSQLAG